MQPPPTLAPGVVYDLKGTLPPGTRSGGRFAVNPVAAVLPPGVLLSVDGVLSLVAGAAPGEFSGIVFLYEEPDA